MTTNAHTRAHKELREALVHIQMSYCCLERAEQYYKGRKDYRDRLGQVRTMMWETRNLANLIQEAPGAVDRCVDGDVAGPVGVEG